eukprot:3535216-Prymnesium_polylepis.1
MGRGWYHLPVPLHMELSSRNDGSKVKNRPAGVTVCRRAVRRRRSRSRQIRSEVVESGFSMLPQHH